MFSQRTLPPKAQMEQHSHYIAELYSSNLKIALWPFRVHYLQHLHHPLTCFQGLFRFGQRQKHLKKFLAWKL